MRRAARAAPQGLRLAERAVDGAAQGAGAVRGGDGALQAQLVVRLHGGQGGDGEAAAALQVAHQASLGGDGGPGGGVVQGAGDLPVVAVVRPALEGQGTLPRRGEEHLERDGARGALASPRRSSPAAARTRASRPAPGSRSLRQRVSTLPRTGTRRRSGRAARRKAARRRLLVPTRGPPGEVFQGAPRRRRPGRRPGRRAGGRRGWPARRGAAGGGPSGCGRPGRSRPPGGPARCPARRRPAPRRAGGRR